MKTFSAAILVLGMVTQLLAADDKVERPQGRKGKSPQEQSARSVKRSWEKIAWGDIPPNVRNAIAGQREFGPIRQLQVDRRDAEAIYQVTYEKGPIIFSSRGVIIQDGSQKGSATGVVIVTGQ
jgi:hypothetical protein